MYTGIILDKESRKKLISKFIHLIPSEWEIIAHHMTINMGPIHKGPADADALGKEVMLTVDSIAGDDLVIAAGVTTDVPSFNKIKHITLAVNRAAGGKPFLSNKLENWTRVDEIDIWGEIKEIQ